MFFYFYEVHKLTTPYFTNEIFSITSPGQFEDLALKAFHFQLEHNTIYRQFCEFLGINSKHIQSIDQVPFLPIELFKNNRIIAGNIREEKIFRSSGTTGSIPSQHFVASIDLYNQTLTEGFKKVFGNPGMYSFIALLPGYVERPDSSLIHMVDQLMRQGKTSSDAFFKEANEVFINRIKTNQRSGVKTILFGVSFSLLEFAYKNPIDLTGVILIETGGMKGHGEEKTKQELHSILKQQFNLHQVYSEYGMTELLSQAYCTHDGIFELPPWMQINIREVNDPQTYLEIGKGGGINVIDLANIYSCCFIATQDLGKKISPNTFEVLGRFDNADIRGCNLLFA